MKRALLSTLIIGALAAAIAIGLQWSGLLAPPAAALAPWLRVPSFAPVGFLDLLVALVLAFAVAWLMSQTLGLMRQLGLLLVLLLELVGAAWVLPQAGFPFHPLPALLAVLCAALGALGLQATASGRRRRALSKAFAGRLGQAGLDRLTSEPIDLDQPSAHEASCVFCEIANEAELIDDLTLAECARLTQEFIELATGHFLQAGAYLPAADGEGVRAIFGFPNPSPTHAAEATRAALALRDDFETAGAARPESLGKIDLRLGVSAGLLVASRRSEEDGSEMVIAGEPLEIARRLARANQVYGSRILLDPRSYNAADKAIVARPIDFLRSAVAHERLEVYELLSLAEKATPEELARRDQFWTAIVYFRERRWNEAFAEFNRARGDAAESDRPLQWYLRRLEPLCLRMATEPAAAGDPLVPL